MRQLSLLHSFMDSYYKLRQLSLLQSVMNRYCKLRQLFITEGDTDGQLLQIAAAYLLQSVTRFVTNCGWCYN